MVEILHFKDKNFDLFEDSFTLYLPSTHIEPIRYESLPGSLRKQMKVSSEDCGLIFKVEHQDCTTTFVAEIPALEYFRLQDRSRTNTYLGEGLVYIQNIEEDEIPVVGYTFTSIMARRRGLGTRRLFTMNAISHAAFDSAINSSASPRLAQRAVWEKLVEKEVAETHFWQETQRYRFIS